MRGYDLGPAKNQTIKPIRGKSRTKRVHKTLLTVDAPDPTMLMIAQMAMIKCKTPSKPSNIIFSLFAFPAFRLVIPYQQVKTDSVPKKAEFQLLILKVGQLSEHANDLWEPIELSRADYLILKN